MTWQSISVPTAERTGFVDITHRVEEAIRSSGIDEGVATVFCPHTTAGLMVNENADPDVLRDLDLVFGELVADDPRFRHAEGNSAAHARSALVGVTLVLPVERGRLATGTWQGVYFCEFDGPRRRSVRVRVTR